MSLDQFASSDGQPPAPRPKPAPAQAPLETDEDLFDFDELLAAKKQAGALDQDLDDVLAAVESAKQEVAQSVKPPAAKPVPSAAPGSTPAMARAPWAEPAPTGVRPVTPAAPQPAAVSTTTVVHQKLTMSPLAGVLLAGVVLVNVTLMLFAWRSIDSVKRMVLDVGHDVADTTSELRAESTRRNEITALQSEPVFGALPEGYRTLEVARERMRRGEHARARRMLYGLLSVIDRIEQPARSEVEAQAGFLIADSYRIEAQSLPDARSEAR